MTIRPTAVRQDRDVLSKRLEKRNIELEAINRQLRESEARFRLLFEQLFDAQVMFTDQGRVEDANQAACRLFERRTVPVVRAPEEAADPLYRVLGLRREGLPEDIIRRLGGRSAQDLARRAARGQVVADGQLATTSNALSVTYRAVADPSGSINSTTANKINFWD